MRARQRVAGVRVEEFGAGRERRLQAARRRSLAAWSGSSSAPWVPPEAAGVQQQLLDGGVGGRAGEPGQEIAGPVVEREVPASTRSRTAAAVNALLTEPMVKTVSMPLWAVGRRVAGSRTCRRSRSPRAAEAGLAPGPQWISENGRAVGIVVHRRGRRGGTRVGALWVVVADAAGDQEGEREGCRRGSSSWHRCTVRLAREPVVNGSGAASSLEIQRGSRGDGSSRSTDGSAAGRASAHRGCCAGSRRFLQRWTCRNGHDDFGDDAAEIAVGPVQHPARRRAVCAQLPPSGPRCWCRACRWTPRHPDRGRARGRPAHVLLSRPAFAGARSPTRFLPPHQRPTSPSAPPVRRGGRPLDRRAADTKHTRMEPEGYDDATRARRS